MDLSKIPARDLDKFIEKYLLPDTRFREEVRQAINIICAFLKEMCFLQAADPVRVSKVVKVRCQEATFLTPKSPKATGLTPKSTSSSSKSVKSWGRRASSPPASRSCSEAS
uniref:2'-5'-oligoadenylate synthetase 1 n=1 Tax=Rousettus aegyptiacus TaxID=9407 RepID=A0A7J8H3S4_ROUAE|nr:2'-5'-oligoadenylate synthetase 1 [Rousettus aegyptiacus]